MRYCGYEIGRQITCEDVERLFNLLHANYTQEELIMLRDDDLHAFAKETERDWRKR